MSETGAGLSIPRQGRPAPVARIVGWSIIAFLVAFLINNVLNVVYGYPSAFASLTGGSSGLIDYLPLLIYIAALTVGVAYVLRTPDTALRWDARRLHRTNIYLIAAAFWAVLLVGVLDSAIAIMRVEKVLDLFMSEEMVRNFGLSRFVGTYVHIPLIVLGFVIAIFSRSLGFPWLALLIVVAELLIVITRFIFSYEQALMGDLVRYWYAALFLFASAYTLFDEGHVRVDVLYSNFGQTTRGYVNAFGSIFLGISTCAVIIAIGFNGKQSIINAPVFNFEITQTGGVGMFVKYQMAAFLGVFAVTMLIQFVSYFFESMADLREEPGHLDHEPVGA